MGKEKSSEDRQIEAMFSSVAYRNILRESDYVEQMLIAKRDKESTGEVSGHLYSSSFNLTEEFGTPGEQSVDSKVIWDVGCGVGTAIDDLQKDYPFHTFIGINPNIFPAPPGRKITIPIYRGRVETLEQLLDKGRRPDLKGKITAPDVILLRNVLGTIKMITELDKKNLEMLLYKAIKSAGQILLPGGKILIYSRESGIPNSVLYRECINYAHKIQLSSEIKDTSTPFSDTFLTLTKPATE